MVTGRQRRCVILAWMAACGFSVGVRGQQPPQEDPPPASTAPQIIVLPVGTRLALVLRNGVSSRTAKPGDSVYFETNYPIAVDGRIVIPMGSFVQGELLAIKRPGRVKGRGEIRIRLLAMTFPNGYVVPLDAAPNSLDNGGRERVDSEGKIIGDSSIGRDLAILGVTTGGGAYVGVLSTIFTGSSPGRGAGIGAGAGLAAGIATVLLTRGPEAELPRGTALDFVFKHPLTLDASRLPAAEAGRVATPPVSPVPPESAHQGEKNHSTRRHLPIRIIQ